MKLGKQRAKYDDTETATLRRIRRTEMAHTAICLKQAIVIAILKRNDLGT